MGVARKEFVGVGFGVPLILGVFSFSLKFL